MFFLVISAVCISIILLKVSSYVSLWPPSVSVNPFNKTACAFKVSSLAPLALRSIISCSLSFTAFKSFWKSVPISLAMLGPVSVKALPMDSAAPAPAFSACSKA